MTMHTIVVLAAVLGIANQPSNVRLGAAEADKLFKEQLESLNHAGENRWMHGVHLPIKARVEEKDVFEDPIDEIYIDWTIEYRGRRSKLIILKPSDHFTECATVFMFHAQTATGAFKQLFIPCCYSSSVRPVILPEWHAVVLPQKQIEGSIRAGVGNVASGLIQDSPGLFTEKPPRIILKLRHVPRERFGDLDAWTGELYSQAVEIKLKRWPFERAGGKK